MMAEIDLSQETIQFKSKKQWNELSLTCISRSAEERAASSISVIAEYCVRLFSTSSLAACFYSKNKNWEEKEKGVSEHTHKKWTIW
jgi:hypothetical protein